MLGSLYSNGKKVYSNIFGTKHLPSSLEYLSCLEHHKLWLLKASKFLNLQMLLQSLVDFESLVSSHTFLNAIVLIGHIFNCETVNYVKIKTLELLNWVAHLK